MSFYKHIISDHGGFGSSDSVRMALALAVVLAADTNAGQANVTAIAFSTPFPDANYAVLVEVGQDVTWWVTDKTAAGFNLHVSPRLAANQIAAGTLNIFIVG